MNVRSLIYQSSTSAGTFARSFAIQSAFASFSAGVVEVTARHRDPAALAASTPASASSTTRQRAGSKPSWWAAARKRSGEGFFSGDLASVHHRVELGFSQADCLQAGVNLHRVAAGGGRQLQTLSFRQRSTNAIAPFNGLRCPGINSR